MAGKRFDWEDVDWTRCNATIAQELAASYGRVAYWRRRLGAPTVRSPRHNRTGEPLVAWNNEVELLRTCRNQEVCAQLNCGLKSVMAASGDLSEYAAVSLRRFVFVSYPASGTRAALPFSKKKSRLPE